MTIAKNQHWITFGGEPVTGRTPARVLVYGPELTGEQTGAVAHAYKLFRDALLVAPSKFLVQNRTLRDGTRVRMTSIQDVDEVFVWTSGTTEEPARDLFVAIPAASGTGGTFDREQYRPALWRNYLKTRAPLALRSSSVPIEEHPGHITWTGGRFMVDGRPVLLSWRGPEDRYSLFKGDGGGIAVAAPPDAWNPLSVGFDPSTASAPFSTLDSSFVWFNGLKVDTGVGKVIAAALFMPDEENSNNVVLRVCTDEFPEGSGIRAWAVYDLVPQDVLVTECTIKKLMSAELPLVKQATYPATDYKANITGADIGKWTDYHRPHFDSRGERLATVIKALERSYLPEGFYTYFFGAGAVFSMPSWEIVTEVRHHTVSSGYTLSTEAIVAIDFLRAKDPDTPDEVVHVKTLDSSTAVADNIWDSSDPEYDLLMQEALTRAGTVSLTHSKHGKLKEAITSGGWGWSGHPWGAPSWWFTPSSRTRFSFVGDLSRDIFAVGVVTTDSPGMSGQLAEGFEYPDNVIMRTQSNPTVPYAVYIDGSEAGSDIDGGKAYDREGDVPYLQLIPVRMELSDKGEKYPPTSFDALTIKPAGYPSTYREYGSYLGAPHPLDAIQILPVYSYSAVDVTRRIAYLGINVSGKADGFNVVVRDLAPGSTEQKVTQLDAETWTAPLFLGPQLKGKQ